MHTNAACSLSPEVVNNPTEYMCFFFFLNITAEVDRKFWEKQVSAPQPSPCKELFILNLISGPKISKTQVCLLLIKALFMMYPEAPFMCANQMRGIENTLVNSPKNYLCIFVSRN